MFPKCPGNTNTERIKTKQTKAKTTTTKMAGDDKRQDEEERKSGKKISGKI